MELGVSTGQDLSSIISWFIAYIIIITVIMFLFHVIIAFFVYRDAESMGMSGGIWAIFVMLLPFSLLLGFIVYLISALILALVYAYVRSNAGFRPSRR